MPPRAPLLLYACVLSAAACSGGSQAAAPSGPGGMPPADVQALTLAPNPVPRTSEFIATVRSLASTTIQPQVEGLVTRIFVKAGDRVRAGQALVQIDPDKQQASVASLEATRVAREADLAYTSQQLARMRKLLDAGAVSRQELEQAETAHRTAEAQLAAVQSQIRENRVELDYYRVTAPTAGIVGEIPVRQGDRVTPATEITTIDEARGLEAYLQVPIERASDLRLGLPVELLDGNGAVMTTDPVTFIAPRADDQTQSVLIKAQLRNPHPTFRVMQYVRARLVWTQAPALTVPVVAVNRISGQYFVFVAEVDQTTRTTVARQKPIHVGEIVGDAYLVRSGLKAGDRVIVSNVQKLGDGAPVKVG